MTKWLVLQLYGPLACWGDIAVGEYRPSADRPSRSAIIGLIAAALGVRSDQEDELERIRKGYRIAYRLDYEGIVVRDYHTTHVPASGTGRNRHVFLTRREELMAPEKDISTILSSRDYRCDSFATVFIEATENAPYSFEKLTDALLNPVFVLYLGRKSCPLAYPLNPRVIEDDSLGSALTKVPSPDLRLRKRNQSQVRVFWENGMNAGIRELHTVVRRDEPVSRKRRQFANRSEHVGIVEVEGR